MLSTEYLTYLAIRFLSAPFYKSASATNSAGLVLPCLNPLNIGAYIQREIEQHALTMDTFVNITTSAVHVAAFNLVLFFDKLGRPFDALADTSLKNLARDPVSLA